MALFLLCRSAYFTSYIGRLNYSSVMTAMILGEILTKSQAGFISMVYFLAYGIGQLCNGLLGGSDASGKNDFHRIGNSRPHEPADGRSAGSVRLGQEARGR